MHLTSPHRRGKVRKKEKSLFYFHIFSSPPLMLYGKHRRRRARTHARQIPFTLLESICSRWTTMALRPLWGHGGVVSVLEMEASLTSQPHLQSPSLKESKQPAGAITWHISIQFPLQNVFIFRLMACHFAGAFGQELILESKQIFRGAIFHQVLIFLHSRSLYSLI